MAVQRVHWRIASVHHYTNAMRIGALSTALQVPICITQLLAHLLFLVANGDQKSRTALPDTFTTPYFVTLAMMTHPPLEFIEDMSSRWGVCIEPDSRVFDLFK